MADYLSTYFEVEKEFGHDIALLTSIAHAIHLNTKPKEKDLKQSGSFGKRVKKKIESALWQHSEQLPIILRLISIVYDFEVGQAFGGDLGGCVKKTIKELYDESIVKDKETGKQYNGYYGD